MMASPLLQQPQPSSQPQGVSTYRRTVSKTPRLVVTGLVLSVGLVAPFIVYNQLLNVMDKESQSWLIYHPVLMTAGVITIPLAAVLQQRLFGYTSNKIHMYAMISSAFIALVGLYVIISHKISKNETHFRYAHDILGLVWLGLVLQQGLGGWLAMDPDNRLRWFSPASGVSNTKRFVFMRRVHTIGGRGILIVGYVTAFLGWLFFFSTDWVRITLMAVALSTLIAISLYDPIMDFVAYAKARLPGLRVGRGA